MPCQGVKELFVAARCDAAATQALLGEGDVTDENAMQYLGILEQRAAELVQVTGASGHSSAADHAAVTEQPAGGLIRIDF
jgi:hypothetical protein